MASHPKFELKQSKNDQYYFNLTAKNGQVIATSEQYTTKAACENGIASVCENAPNAGTEDETAGTTCTNPKFCLKEAKNGQFYFNLTATNGQTIATSEMYTTKAACENGIASVCENAPNAETEDQTVDTAAAA